jgi:hypothetical protein
MPVSLEALVLVTCGVALCLVSQGIAVHLYLQVKGGAIGKRFLGLHARESDTGNRSNGRSQGITRSG